MTEDTNHVSSFAHVSPNAQMGKGNIICIGVVIHDNVIIGDDNYIGPYTVIGERGEYRNPPEMRETEIADACAGQVSEFMNRPLIIIGNRNRISELVAIQAPVVSWRTIIGDDCMIMHRCHIAHDCRLGDFVTMAPGVTLGGVVKVEGHANIGMNAAIHPRLTVGEGAMVGMVSTITHNVKPWRTVVHVNTILGFNLRGMQKAGWTPEQIAEFTKDKA